MSHWQGPGPGRRATGTQRARARACAHVCVCECDFNLPLHRDQAPQPRSCSAGACETCSQIGRSTVLLNQEKRIRFARLFALRNVPPRPVRNLRLHEVGRLSLKRVPDSTAPVPVPFTSRLSPARKKHSQGKAQQRTLVNMSAKAVPCLPSVAPR